MLFVSPAISPVYFSGLIFRAKSDGFMKKVVCINNFKRILNFQPKFFFCHENSEQDKHGNMKCHDADGNHGPPAKHYTAILEYNLLFTTEESLP